jgi:hypothetical protein
MAPRIYGPSREPLVSGIWLQALGFGLRASGFRHRDWTEARSLEPEACENPASGIISC